LQCSKFGNDRGLPRSSGHLSEYYNRDILWSTYAIHQAVPGHGPGAKIEVTTRDSHGAWYTQPVWIGIGIIALVLIIVLISLAGRRDRTTIVK